MTDTNASTQSGTLRVERDSRRAVHHTEAGRVAIPIVVHFTDDASAIDAEMVLAGDDAETLCEAIDALLRGKTVAPGRPKGSASVSSRRASLQDSAFAAPGA